MHFSLVMKLTDGTERKFPLTKSRTLIGRETRCNVRIALPNVADRHCEIVLDNGELKLSDLGSELGTLVNGESVRKTVLGPADELTVGPVTFLVRSEQAVERDAVTTDTVPTSPDGVVAPDAGSSRAQSSPHAPSDVEVNLRAGNPRESRPSIRDTAAQSDRPQRKR